MWKYIIGAALFLAFILLLYCAAVFIVLLYISIEDAKMDEETDDKQLNQ